MLPRDLDRLHYGRAFTRLETTQLLLELVVATWCHGNFFPQSSSLASSSPRVRSTPIRVNELFGWR